MKKKNPVEILLPDKTLELEIEKYNYKDELTLKITKVSGDNAEITDKKFII